MHYLSSLWKVSLLGGILFGCTHLQPLSEKEHPFTDSLLQVDTFSTVSSNKLQLTRAYALTNYGVATWLLDSVKMVVVHFTVIPTWQQTLELFAQDSLLSNRTYIKNFSALNVGIHYVVDRDGSIHNLMPDSVMARHLIGFNHVSIGIENIARDSSELTQAQLESNARLIRFLKTRHPEMEYLIGHDEYNRTELPHYKLFKSLDKGYQPYDKPDPGSVFMVKLRKRLKDEYDLQFLE